MGKTQGVTNVGPVLLHVAHGQQAWVTGMQLHFVDDALCQWAGVKSIGTLFGHHAQHFCQARVGEHMAHREWRAIRFEKIGHGLRVFQQTGFGFEQCMQSGADRKSFVCQFDRGLEQTGPRQATVLLVRNGEHAQDARHADSASTTHHVVKRQRLAIEHEQVLRRKYRCCFAAIEHLQSTAIVVQQKRAATDTAGLRFNQSQHHLHSNGRIYRRSSSLQDTVSGFAGQRVRCGHTTLFQWPAGFVCPATGCFGLCNG